MICPDRLHSKIMVSLPIDIFIHHTFDSVRNLFRWRHIWFVGLLGRREGIQERILQGPIPPNKLQFMWRVIVYAPSLPPAALISHWQSISGQVWYGGDGSHVYWQSECQKSTVTTSSMPNIEMVPTVASVLKVSWGTAIGLSLVLPVDLSLEEFPRFSKRSKNTFTKVCKECASPNSSVLDTRWNYCELRMWWCQAILKSP